MKYKIINNFLSDKFCEELIFDANKYSKDDHIEVLNHRKLLPSTSLSFINLIKKSDVWKKLHNKLNSQKFLNDLIEYLDFKDQNYTVTNFFFEENPSDYLKKYKSTNQKVLSNVGSLNLIFYQFFKFYRTLKRYLKFYFSSKNFIELIYDYSKSPNGYKREIHRDSDSRTIVFLIYLNKLSDKGKGGNLRLYKYSKESQKIPSRPKEEECELIEDISPETGKLITFLNSYDSLHDVSEMKNHDGYRHFLYGSFTLLAKKNPLLKKSKGGLKTNFNSFE